MNYFNSTGIKKIILWIKNWWHWNIVLKRRIKFPAIENLNCGISIEKLISENQYTYTKNNNWLRWIDKNEN